MRITLGLLCLMFSITSINSQGINFFEGDLAALKAEALKENKIIFVDAFTTWCGPCKWMAKNTFPDAKVGELFNSKFISYKFDMEKGEGPAFAKAYKVHAYPTLVFINGKGELMHKTVGALNPEQLIQAGKDALNPEVRIGDLIKKYKAGERSPAFIMNYLTKATEAMVDVKEAGDWYFYTQTDEELMTKENVELITQLGTDPKNKGFQFLLKNQAKCQALTESDLEGFIGYVYGRSLALAEREGDAAYQEAVAELKKSGYLGADGLLAKRVFGKMLKAEKKDWKVITEKIDEYFSKYAPKDAQTRNQLAWDYYTNAAIQDKKMLESALGWAKQSVAIEEGFANTDTYAALLYKLGRKKAATQAAKKAIQLAKDEGQDASETEELLEKINKL